MAMGHSGFVDCLRCAQQWGECGFLESNSEVGGGKAMKGPGKKKGETFLFSHSDPLFCCRFSYGSRL